MREARALRRCGVVMLESVRYRIRSGVKQTNARHVRVRRHPKVFSHLMFGSRGQLGPMSINHSTRQFCKRLYNFMKIKKVSAIDHKQFQMWPFDIDSLSQAQPVLLGEAKPSASLEAIEARLAESRECPRCGAPGAVSRGKALGLRRYKCKACSKTFNAATGTPLQGGCTRRTNGSPSGDASLTGRQSAPPQSVVILLSPPRFIGCIGF